MRPIQLVVRRSEKIDVGKRYESKDVFASLTIEIEPGDNLEKVYDNAWAIVQNQIHRQKQLILQGDEAMPIEELKGGAMFATIGHIRKGAPKQANRPGEDLDYFRVEFDTDDASLIQEKFLQIYGERPRELRIMLLDDDIDRVFDAWREAYTSGGLVHRCNGSIVEYPFEQRGERCTLKDHPDERRQCKPVGRLRVMLPELGRAGMMIAHTGSWKDIRELYANLEAILSLAGRLRGIPLILRRVERDVSRTDEDGRRKKKKMWLLHLEIAPEWVERRLLAIKEASLLQASSVPMLVSGEDDDQYDIDCETGEIYEASPAAHVAEPLAPSGTKRVSIGELRERLSALEGPPATKKQRGSVAGLFTDLVGKEARVELLAALTGHTSTADLSMAQAAALIKWAQSESAKEEAAACLREFAEEHGQTDMLGDGADDPQPEDAGGAEAAEFFPEHALRQAIQNDSLLCPTGSLEEALKVLEQAKQHEIEIDTEDQGATLARLRALINRLADAEAAGEEPAPTDMFGNSLEPEAGQSKHHYEYE